MCDGIKVRVERGGDLHQLQLKSLTSANFAKLYKNI